VGPESRGCFNTDKENTLTTDNTAGDPGLQLIHALYDVWQEIRRHHPEVPEVVLLPAPAQRRRVLGHFAPLRWTARQDGTGYLHEVVVVAEYLNRDPVEVIETLIHEAAHALNFTRGIHDCSRSQYHNTKFKAAAEELGLEVTQVKHYGFALTRMSQTATDRYAEVAGKLRQVIVHRRSWAGITKVGGSTPKGGNANDNSTPSSRSRKATCACGYIIRVSKKTMAETEIRCQTCDAPFTLAR